MKRQPGTARGYGRRYRDLRGRFISQHATSTMSDSLHAAGLGTLDQPPYFAATLAILVEKQMRGEPL